MAISAQRKVLSILNLLGFIAVVVVNALANILPIGGQGTGAVSDSYPNLFVPAGFTFSIWGVIYLLLAIFCVYQLVAVFGSKREPAFMDKIGWLFFLSCLLNIAWIFVWQYRFPLISLAVMLALLICLLAIYLRVGQKRSMHPLVWVPFSVYLGWITVATVANVTAVLVDLGWNGFGLSEPFWACAMIAAAGIIGITVVLSRRDPFYGLVLIWAYAGIVAKRATVDADPVWSVVITAGIAIALFLISIIIAAVARGGKHATAPAKAAL